MEQLKSPIALNLFKEAIAQSSSVENSKSRKQHEKSGLSKVRAAELALLLTGAAIGMIPSLKADAQSADIKPGSCTVLLPNADPNQPPVEVIQQGGCGGSTNVNPPAALPPPAAVPQTVNEPAPTAAPARANSTSGGNGGNNEQGFNPLYGVGIALLGGVTFVKWLTSRK